MISELSETIMGKKFAIDQLHTFMTKIARFDREEVIAANHAITLYRDLWLQELRKTDHNSWEYLLEFNWFRLAQLEKLWDDWTFLSPDARKAVTIIMRTWDAIRARRKDFK